MIKTLNNTNINISECYVLWMIVGNPLKLSVFSPNNREFQVNCIKESLTLQQDKPIYSIKTPFFLSQEYTILINTTNFEPKNIIKLIEWSYNSINFQIIKSESSVTDIDLHICILCSDCKSLKIDYGEEKCSLNLFGTVLTKENLNENLFNEINKFDSIQNIIKQHFMDDDIQIVRSVLSEASNNKPSTTKDYYTSKSSLLNLSKLLYLSKELNEIQKEKRI